MSTTHELLHTSRALLDRIMDREGVLDDEDETILDDWLGGCESKLEGLRALYRRAESEAALWKREQDRLRAMQKRAESTMAWAKLAGLELLTDRAELGESTSIKGVAHLRLSKALRAPESPLDWPVAYLVEQEPRPDRAGALKALKAGADLGDGFGIDERPSVVYR